MDGEGIIHRHVDACEQPAGAGARIPTHQPNRTQLVSIVRTDPFMRIDNFDKLSLCREWRWFAIILVITLLAVFAVIRPGGNRLSTTQKWQYQSELQLKSIACLDLAFTTNFHAEPRQLSQLVPSDRIDLIPTFYAPNRPDEKRPLGWQTNRLGIDLYSDYAIPTRTHSTILVFEKPGLWFDGTVAVCLTNLKVVRIPLARFEALLGNGETNSPPTE